MAIGGATRSACMSLMNLSSNSLANDARCAATTTITSSVSSVSALFARTTGQQSHTERDCSAARAMILSSMSVMFITCCTSMPNTRRRIR